MSAQTETDMIETDDDIGERRDVGAFVNDEVLRLAPETSLRGAAEAMRTADVSLAVVGEGDDIEGVISERDLVAAIALGRDLDTTAVSVIESDSLKWAAISSSVDDVAEEMLETYVRHILVCNDDGTLAGVVSMRDLLAAYLV